MNTPDDPQHQFIDASLASWRQGDCVLQGEHWFVHRTEPQVLDTKTEGSPSSLIESEVPGLVVVTQSCDVVRPYRLRPYVSVSPLVEVTDAHLLEIGKGYRPQFAAIPGLSKTRLVADLDRVMTVDKQVVSGWTRVKGCSEDAEVRAFSKAVERKYGRVAFPDDFNHFAKKLQSRIEEKHDKKSKEGDALRNLDEIRVRAAPSWESPEVELMFWFVANADNVADVIKSGFVVSWLKLVEANGRFKSVQGQITTHQDMTAEDYLESDLLDLDHLSGE